MVRFVNVLCLMFISAALTFGEDYQAFFNKVKENNDSIKIEEISRLIAEKNYEKEMILADSEDKELNAEIKYISVLSGFRNNMKNIHIALFSLILDTHVQEMTYAILEMESRIAFLDYQYLKKMDDLVYIKGQDVNEAFIEYKIKELDVLRTEWEKQEAYRQFMEYTGLEWGKSFPELVKEYSIITIITIDEKEWKKEDLLIKGAELRVQLADYELKSLPGNVSKYEYRIKEMEYEKAWLEYKATVKDSLSDFRRIYQELGFLLNTMSLLKENSTSYDREIKDAESRYKKKLITEKELLLKRVYSLTLQKKYYETLKEYINSVITLLSTIGKNPEEVLK